MIRLAYKRKNAIVILAMFLFLFSLNSLMPLAFGDDYLYSFVWQGNPMFVPLSDEAKKIASLSDLFISQLSFYYTWSGRIINNTISQLFAWAGKDVFNVLNSLAVVMLMLEIYWCSNRGRITMCFDTSILCCLFLLFWTFTPDFPSVVLWMIGACHYLWPAVFLLGFMIPYIQNYYCRDTKQLDAWYFSIIFFMLGIIAGCTNENSICWIIIMLAVYVCEKKKKKEFEIWMLAGLLGLTIGYFVLMFSPGNFVRLLATHGKGWLQGAKIIKNLHVLAMVVIFQFILWYFCIRSIMNLNWLSHQYRNDVRERITKDFDLSKYLCIISAGMTLTMIFSPEFHLRSAFPGTAQLLIAAGIIIRIQKEYGIELLHSDTIKFLTCIGVMFFIISASVTMYHLYERHIYNEMILTKVSCLKHSKNASGDILYIKPSPKTKRWIDFISGFHTLENDLTPNVDSWENVAFARYYGIRGVCLQDGAKH